MKLIDLTVSRLIPAAPDEVYDVWLDPKCPGGLWFGVERVILDVKVDGLFYHSVKHEGRFWAHYGRFVALERGRRVEHTWMSEATKGLETMVRVSFEAASGGTQVTLRHDGLLDDEMGRGHQAGWKWYLEILGEKFAKQKS
jgi:uncharacterized protein YndB with AHSA1/START domain